MEGSPRAATPDHVDDHGAFLLSLAGRKIGTENFEIKSYKDRVEARADIQLRINQEGKTYDFKSSPHLVLNREFEPMTYTWDQKGSQASHLEIDFRLLPVASRYRTVAGQDDNRSFELPKDVIVLDDNVVHHYELVVARYGLTPGGKQTFHAFIPQEALPGVLTVEEMGPEPVELEGKQEKLQHLVVTTELARIDLWVDGRRHLRRVSIPSAQFEAVREK